MTITPGGLFLTWVALSLSISALLVALRILALYRSSRPSALSMRLQETEDTVEAIQASVKGLKARIGMQEVRARRRADAETEPTELDNSGAAGAEFRRKMNAALAAGQVSALPRR